MRDSGVRQSLDVTHTARASARGGKVAKAGDASSSKGSQCLMSQPYFLPSDTKGRGGHMHSKSHVGLSSMQVYLSETGPRDTRGFSCCATPRVWTRGATGSVRAPSLALLPPRIEHPRVPRRKETAADVYVGERECVCVCVCLCLGRAQRSAKVRCIATSSATVSYYVRLSVE
ncbi:hypothetical protein VUR80DRAFT_3113 [Thermomyces stellatus]